MAPRTGIALLLALSAMALSAGPAMAAPDTVPPDNSGAAQYTEALPGAGGDRPTKNLDKGRGGKAGGQVLNAKQKARLKALGKEGAEAAELADANGGAAGDRQGGGASSDPDGSSGAGEVLSTVTGSSDDSGGIDLLLVLLVALAVLAAVALVLVRRGNRTT